MNRLAFICSQPECGRKHHSAGLCRGHHQQMYDGRPLSPLRARRAKGESKKEATAFLEKAAAETGDQCVDWPFRLDGHGYGVFADKDGGGRRIRTRANRASCEKRHGPPPFPEAVAAHNCGRRKCVSGNHLRWATSAENSADMVAHGTQAIGEQVHNAKLTTADVIAIRASKEKLAPLAERYGVSIPTIHFARTGRNWGHVAEKAQSVA